MSTRHNPHIRDPNTERLFFSPTEEIRKLDATQKVNQKVVLSFYGAKIDLPFKFISMSNVVSLVKQAAVLEDASHEVMESYKVEVSHPFGVTYFRKDVMKEQTASTLSGDAYALAELNMQSRREFEDYLIQRKQYDLDYSAMDLSHREARLARKYEYVNKGIDFVLGTATLGVTSFKGATTIANIVKSSRQKAKENYATDLKVYEWLTWKNLSFGMADKPPKKKWFAPVAYKNKEMSIMSGLGMYQGASRTASGIAGLVHASERASLQEEGFGIEIQKKALQSYEIDLSYEREKDEQLINMRRLFADEMYNEVSDRQRQRLLDELETPPVKDIYLEVWTTSDRQKWYVENYHKKFGVDCRVHDFTLKIKDNMEEGIYCIEDVEITNLYDRVDFTYLKSRLTGGIRFIKWVEHERVNELTKEDLRIIELKRECAQVKSQLQLVSQEYQQKRQELETQVHTLSDEVNVEADKYHTLSESFRKNEAKLQEQTKLVTLYRDEANHYRQDLLKETSQHATEKQGHIATKAQLESKTQENAQLTLQIDAKIKEVEEKKREVEQARQEKQQTLDELSRTKLEVTSKQQQIEEQQQQLQRKDAQIQQDQKTIQTTQAEVAKVKKNNQTLVNNNRRFQAEIATLKKEKAEWEQKKQELQSCQEELQKEKAKPDNSALEAKIKDLEREKQEAEQSLSALRELNNQKEVEIAELKKKTQDTAPLWYLPRYRYITYTREGDQPTYSTIPSGMFHFVLKQPDILIAGFQDKIYFCKFNEMFFCWQILSDNDLYRVKRYSSYALLRVTKKDVDNQFRDNTYTWDARIWENDYYAHNYPTYFSENITSYAHLVKILGQGSEGLRDKDTSAWLTKKNIRVLDTGSESIPIFKFEEEVPTRETPLLKIVYYDKVSGNWEKQQNIYNEYIQISNYGDYLDLLGLELYQLPQPLDNLTHMIFPKGKNIDDLVEKITIDNKSREDNGIGIRDMK